MDLNILWFILIAVLFTGFFFLEGFDYGVGMTIPFISSSENNRTLVINTIAPVWDGNEVWMITAGGALFAAFPHVYATMFSTFYLALFLMLLALILRGAGLELRSKHESYTWRRLWDWAICLGSALPAFLWGVAITNLLRGLPISDKMIYMGTFYDLLTPYTVVGGITFLLVFLFHGMAFLHLRLVEGSLTHRMHDWAIRVGALAIFAFLVCIAMTYTLTDLFRSQLAAGLLFGAALCFVAAYLASFKRRDVPTFVGSSLAIACTTAAFFAGLFPRLMVSSLQPEWSLTIYNASSTPYTLTIMSIAADCLVPVVLLYQGWSYWIFRKRLSRKDLELY